MIDRGAFSLKGKRVWVAGRDGLVGSALVRRLASEGCAVIGRGRAELELRDQAAVFQTISNDRPEVMFVAAAKVGGIAANDRWPAQFLYDNLVIQSNLIEAARRAEVEKLVFLGSSCIYPRHALQPISEEALLTGPLEPTNQWYAIAKIAGLKLIQAYRREYGCDFISAMPTNLYGPNDNFDTETSHVLPALIRRFHEAKARGDSEVVVWGSGRPRREFMHVDDCADALILLTKQYSAERHINVGVGSDVSIRELAELIADVTGFGGVIVQDEAKPDGTPQKLLDTGRLSDLGWNARIGLREGIEATYRWYLEEYRTR